MIINRDTYLRKLISRRHNGMIKIVTGVRRCGKSFLLSTIYASWLREQGVDESHIITIDLEDRRNKQLRDPDVLLGYIDSKIKDNSVHYIMIDEIQHVPEFEDVLNSYLKMPNADVYVTGSNAKFLSKDIITTFRGRGDEIKLFPLSFREIYPHMDMLKDRALTTYMLYGGLPQILFENTDEEKNEYLKALFTHTYLKDIVERYHIRNTEILDELLNILASGIGSLTNPTKLVNTFESVKHERVNRMTLSSYLDYICDSFLIEKATRYDIKGKRYIDSPYKYYFVDCGLRNARLNFRQTEPSHLMENVIYNEMRVRGYNVDVGVVPVRKRTVDGINARSQLEVDFVCNLGSKRYYIQSAYRMPDEEKLKQEEASLVNIDDSFKKIIIVGEDIPILRNEAGIMTIGIYDFLLNDNSLDL
ncbi:MAG: ATP-binding protein [Candidatus Amulumruptor caecigallinarius]|nr:ATP-binding protein [Candidatus Amulumruptor caecigallinarius]MCM1397336.1 ATP-binding protein [Candidatus Amulumruptor caecigallinarius]